MVILGAFATLVVLSSANLTQQAFTTVVELGVLARGEMMSKRVEEQFWQLIVLGTLVGL